VRGTTASCQASSGWPNTIEAVEATTLAARIWDVSRTQPLVVVSPVPGLRPRLLLNPQRLAGIVGDEAEIVVLADHNAAQALCALLPERLRFGTGSARVFFPGADQHDRPRRHPWVFVEPKNPQRAEQEIAAFLRPKPVTVWSSINRAPDVRPDPLEEARRDLDAARARVKALSAESRRLIRQLAELRSREASCRFPPAPVVYADPENQLRYEIEQYWLRTVPENERAEASLTGYVLGLDFLDSLAAIQVVGRGAVVAAIVDVLTGLATVKNGRRAHRQRVGRGGGTAPLLRADGASAWRCDIRSSTPAAPRLLWWALTDGGIELAKATVHDDNVMRCP